MTPTDNNPSSALATTSSERRIAANRRNALQSTGPKTDAGKAMVSQNARKHGLRVARNYPCIPEESEATFALFRQELQDVLQPHNTLQRHYLPQIVNLAWRLLRLPEAQAKIFEYEKEKAPGDTPLTAPELIARRFSDDPRNGFLLLDRYERSMQRALVRLLKIYREAAGPDPYRPDEISPEELMNQTNPFNTTEKYRQQLKNDLLPPNVHKKIGRTNPWPPSHPRTLNPEPLPLAPKPCQSLPPTPTV